MIRLMIVDDHKVVRLGLAALFKHRPNVEIVGEAGTVAEAIEQATRVKPDIILMDVRLPDGSGIDACREIRATCAQTRVLFLTSFADEDAMLSTILAGAAGFLLKQADEEGLVRAVETVASGQSVLDPAAAQPLLERLRSLSTQPQRAEAAPSGPLSKQEERVMALVIEGKTNKEIAVEMGLSEKTIKNYLGSIFQKLQVSRRSQAAALFARQSAKRGPSSTVK